VLFQIHPITKFQHYISNHKQMPVTSELFRLVDHTWHPRLIAKTS